jgi:curved DNA-binding protein CbpA
MATPLRYDHYIVLGVARDATLADIKRAYRERVKQWHPDRNHSPQAGEVFSAVHDAYRVLCEPALREAYDQRLQRYRPITDQTADRQSPHPRNTTGRNSDIDLPVNRFAFIGLHMTGLLFGVSLVLGILTGIVFFGWPGYFIVFTAPGMAVIPDSVAGLRVK